MTGNDVYNIAMSLIDERLESGVIDATSTATYEKNAPFILNLLQADLVDKIDTKTHTITKALTETYESYDMPSDFYSARQVIEIDTNNNYNWADNFKWEKDSILIVPAEFQGTIKVVYRPIPALVIALTDTLTVDPITARTTLAYGLASRLLTNENRAMANYFNDLYEENKNRPKRNVAFSIKIKDKYDSSCSY